jgi:hypothetical protein
LLIPSEHGDVVVNPAQAGIQRSRVATLNEGIKALDSRLRGNDGNLVRETKTADTRSAVDSFVNQQRD